MLFCELLYSTAVCAVLLGSASAWCFGSLFSKQRKLDISAVTTISTSLQYWIVPSVNITVNIQPGCLSQWTLTCAELKVRSTYNLVSLSCCHLRKATGEQIQQFLGSDGSRLTVSERACTISAHSMLIMKQIRKHVFKQEKKKSHTVENHHTIISIVDGLKYYRWCMKPSWKSIPHNNNKILQTL